MPGTNDIVIPEMQKVKEKYPVYKDMPDVGLLNTIVRKYPVYKPIADRVAGEIGQQRQGQLEQQQGTITSSPVTIRSESQRIMRNIELGMQGEDPDRQIPLVLGKPGTLVRTIQDAARLGTEAAIPVAKAAVETGRILFDRPLGAVKSLVAGGSPIDGWKNPEKQESFGESFIKATGGDLNNPLVFGTAVAYDIAANLGTMHLFYNVPPKLTGEAKKAVVTAYTGAQGRAVKELKDTLVAEFKVAGMTEKTAQESADTLIAQGWSKAGFFRKTPLAVNQMTTFLKASPGSLGEHIKTTVATAKEAAVKKGFTDDFFRKMREASPKLTGESPLLLGMDAEAAPTTTLGKQLKAQMLAKEQVPLHPASEGRLELAKVLGKPAVATPAAVVSSKIENTKAPLMSLKEQNAGIKRGKAVLQRVREQQQELFDQHPITKVSIPPVKPEELQAKPQISDEVLQRPANQTPEVRAAAKQVQAQPTPEIHKPVSKEERLRLLKETAAQRQLRQRTSDDYSMDTFYDVTFKDSTGVHSSMVDGEELLQLEKLGQVVNKRKWNKKGSVDLQWMHDLIDDFVGEKEKIVVMASQVAKSLGAPFMIGEKYPSFKPVHMAVSDAIDRKNEMFVAGAHRLQPKFQRSLPDVSKEKLTDVIKLGNSPGVEKYYSPEELVKQFGFNEKEVEAYTRLKRTYDLATNMEIQSRKLGAGYADMTDGEKVLFDQQVQKQVARRGGFVTQQRLSGDWMVYAPPEEGSDVASFFNLYESRSAALKAQEALGPGATISLRTKMEQQMYRNLSLSDLESLIEAAGVSNQSQDVSDLRKVLQERSFASHWIKRKNVPGYEWNWDNVTASAIDYLEGAANKLARIEGRINSTKAFRENVGKMSPGLSAYTQKFLDGFYNTGAIGFRGFGAFMHLQSLALKPSFLAQNLTQSLSTTWPEMSKYFSGVELEASFARASANAVKYIAYLLKGEAHGLDSETFGYLEKLRKQGYIGDQIARFELQVRHPILTTFDRATTLFGRMTEPPNRIIAGLVARDAAMQKIGLTDKKAIFEFGKNKISRTQFRYDKANLPTLITGAGNMRNWLRAAYTFRSFSVNYLQLLNSMMPWRGASAKQYTRAMGSILLQAGIKGIPFFGVGALAYKAMVGRTLDNDMREAMEEANIPDKAIDVALHGAYSVTGVDASGLIGLGDVAGYNGGIFERLAGAPIGQMGRYQKAVEYLALGRPDIATEEASPAVLRNLLKAKRYAKEGVRNMAGELLLNPSKLDIGLTALGFTPMSISKMYDAEDAKTTMRTSASDKTSAAHQKIARLLDEGKRNEAYKEWQKARKEGVGVNAKSIKEWRLKRRGIDKSTPKKLRRTFRNIDERYGVEK